MKRISFWRWVCFALPFLASLSFAQSGPTITTQPESKYVTAGGAVTLSVTATAASALTYQWRLNGQPLAGATTASYTISGIQEYESGTYTVIVSANGLSVTSNPAIITVLTVPTFVGVVQNRGVVAGRWFSMYAQFSGSSPMTYQWMKDGVNIPGATGYSYDISTMRAENAGTYSVTASNAAGTTTATFAVLTVVEAISITAQPVGRTVAGGADVTLSVTATGPGTLKYQWYKEGYQISAATSSSLVLNDVDGAVSGRYWVRVYNEYEYSEVESNEATVTVQAPPSIITQPRASQSVTAGNSFYLEVAAGGGGSITYQWRKDGVNLVQGGKISGATSNWLWISSPTAAEAGTYTVVVSNEWGSVTSTNSVISVNADPNAPSITQQPASQSVVTGGAVTFEVQATTYSSYGLSYQWKKDGVDVAGQISRTFSIVGATAANAGTYTVVVTNSWGSVTSSPATLAVTAGAAAPVITGQPASQTVFAGSDVTMTVEATGTPTPALQWLKDGTAIPGAVGSILILRDVKPVQAGKYSVVATNSAGTATSIASTLTVQSRIRVVNLSTRAYVGRDAEVLIAGFVINGTTPKQMLVRAVGPGLSKFGVEGVLTNPFLRIADQGGNTVATNDDWSVSAQVQELSSVMAKAGAFPLNAESKDAAVLVTLNPGNYTALVSGADNGMGVALAEVYEVDDTTSNHLVNISSRAVVGTGGRVLIPGIAVTGTGKRNFLVRAVGPGLAPFGVAGTIANPKLELVDSANNVVASNDDWGTSSNLAELTTASSALGAFGLPSGSKDAALLVELPPGNYTAVVSGVGGATGVALVEVYQAP